MISKIWLASIAACASTSSKAVNLATKSPHNGVDLSLKLQQPPPVPTPPLTASTNGSTTDGLAKSPKLNGNGEVVVLD